MTTTFIKDTANSKMFVSREFAAPLDQVWNAWTDSGILDQWWAPKPWNARTKMMDFREGGFWLYYMEGPKGEKPWSRADFKAVKPKVSFEGIDSFTDEQGKKNGNLPASNWRVVFAPTSTGTKVDVEITFDSQEDMQKFLELGFEEGFTGSHQNLDALLAK